MYAVAVIVFVATYAVVAVGRLPRVPVDRTVAAAIGALLMIAIGAIGPGDALRAIDRRTLGLLFLMMLAAAPLRLPGVADRVARLARVRRIHPATPLVAVVAVAGALSAILLNDTVCLVFTPLVLDLARARGQRPLPYLLALATAANIGSAATIIGNPQNLLIGSLSGVGFRRFTAALGPVAAAGLAIDAVVLWAVFGRELRRTAAFVPAPVPAPPDARRLTAGRLAAAVDWRLLLLFAGLFVVVGAAARVGIDDALFELVRPLGTRTIGGLALTTAALSNLVSNVPAVMLFTPIVPRLPDPDRAWLVLAMASTLAGNLTIVGSIANLIVVESARRQGARVRWTEYLAVGVPVTALTLAFGIWWLAP